jgi:hypothetical protein
MKKIINVLLGMGCILMCTSCSTQKGVTISPDAANTTESTTAWEAGGSLIDGDYQELSEVPETWPIVELSNVNAGSVEFNEKTDGDSFTTSTNYSQSEDAFFTLAYIIDKVTIFSFNKQTHSYNAVCNRPDCKHTDAECSAYFENAFGLEYYNGKLYTMAVEEEVDNVDEDERGQTYTSGRVYVNLYEISLDGSSKRKVQCIKTVEKAMDEYSLSWQIEFFIHRGFVYYTYNIVHPLEEDDIYKNGNNCLYRVPIGGDETEAECIIAFTGDDDLNIMPEIKPYGDYLYFSYLSTDDPAGKLYRINTVEKKVEKLPIEEWVYDADFFVENDCIYYYGPENSGIVYCYSFSNNSKKVVMDFSSVTELKIMGIFYDGTYWYGMCIPSVSEGGYPQTYKAIIMDSQFQKIGEIERSATYTVAFDIKDVVAVINGSELYGWIDKSEFAKGIFTIHEVESSE